GQVRKLISYGVVAEHAGCARLHAILREMEFAQPGRRRIRLDFQHAEAFITTAIELGRVSLALGTALQFETTMRQRDVIGEWEPIQDSEPETGIILRKRRWVNGLTWSDIPASMEVYKITTKTGAEIAHDLKLCPMVLDVLAQIPPERRMGALIVDEEQGRPYAEHAYAREWRKVARAAGIPDNVWNMDARAGGISEADEAGAEIGDIQRQAGHSQLSTTQRYARAPIGKSRRVARIRAAHRQAKNEA
ncbi:tyrosine-type recombinase/integrase, partial [Nostoc sp. NIES-2111]